MGLKWQIDRLILVHVGLALLFFLWFFPLTAPWIAHFDRQSAYFFNGFVVKTPLFQNIWAYFNSDPADWLLDLEIALFALFYILAPGEKSRKRKCVECLFLTLFAFAYFHLFHQGIVKKWTRPVRLSPTGVLDDLFHLSSVITWTDVKIFSRHSYPSDHGTTVCTFILSAFFLRGKRWGLLVTFLAAPFALARLVTGAHWLTDLLCGSFAMTLFNFAWLFYTPAFTYITQALSQERRIA